MIGRVLNWFIKRGPRPNLPELPHRMQCQMCRQPATMHITEGRTADTVEEIHLCEACASRFLYQSTPQAEYERKTSNLSSQVRRSEGILSATNMTGIVTAPPFGIRPVPVSPAIPEVHLVVCRIIISELHEHQVIMLKEVDGDRSFSISIGIFEAVTVERTYKKLLSPRPLTHDAWLNTLNAVGVTVQAACIKELREHTYFASLRLVYSGQLTEVDVRPSDAVHLALKAEAPLLIPETLLAEVCESGR